VAALNEGFLQSTKKGLTLGIENLSDFPPLLFFDCAIAIKELVL
jgi:hypothetical protein